MISIVSAAALLLAVFSAVRFAFMLLRGRNRRRMFAPSLGSLSDGAGETGLSVICLGAYDAASVAGLLTVEYERYEVLAVTDSAGMPGVLRELADRYALVKVDYSPHPDFAPGLFVRGLYRSRRRRFRRLTVVDMVPVSAGTCADAAAGIALYEYVALVHGGARLLPYAVERVVAEICSPERPPHEISTASGAGLVVYRREDVVRRGGFSSGRHHFCRRGDRVKIYETLAVSETRYRGIRIAALLSALLTAVAAWVSVAAGEWLPVAVAAASLATVAASVIFASCFAAPHLKGWRAAVWTLGDFCEKLLLKISQ